MPKIRVLIVDDAVLVRSRVSKLLSNDPDLEVVGVAANGHIALAKIPLVNPDLIVLDVEMPEINGIETLAAIRQSYPLLPVIMFSTFTHSGAKATLEALSLGANDYATKPSNLGSVEAANQHIREELIPKIKLFGSTSKSKDGEVRRWGDGEIGRWGNRGPHEVEPARCSGGGVCSEERGIRGNGEIGRGGDRERGRGGQINSKFYYTPHPTPHTPHPLTPTPSGRVDIVAIGVSTGGPNALAVLLSQLPADFPVPIAIVQHMPPMFTKLLAEQLASKCQIRVDEAIATVLEPGRAWIAPGDFHMIVERDSTVVRIGINQAAPENSCRPSVDVLFRSVAQVYGARALAVVLTGMGQDGLQGCECIRAAGGQILVQDRDSSVVWGMPGFVANAGLAEAVVPLDQMAGEILSRVRQD